MANEENLIPQAHKLTVEEASKGGKKSGETRRRKKEFREIFETMLNEAGGTLNGEPVTKKELATARMVKILLDANTSNTTEFMHAFQMVRDTIGEKPVEKIVMADINQEAIDEVEKMIYDEAGSN